jgi:hypothetical protein
MTNDSTCEEIRELAPEVALDIAAGEDRDTVLRHVTSCDDCRHLVFELSSVGDGLLMALAPSRQPKPDFESKVLTAIDQQAPDATVRRPRPNRRFRTVMATGAVAIAALIGAATVYLATSADRELGEAYRATLAVGQGSAFAAAPIEGPSGRVGVVFAYQGDPSWVVVTLDPGSEASGPYLVRIATGDGDYRVLGEMDLAEGDSTWSEELPFDLSEVAEIQFVDRDGLVVFSSGLHAAEPWK